MQLIYKSKNSDSDKMYQMYQLICRYLVINIQ